MSGNIFFNHSIPFLIVHSRFHSGFRVQLGFIPIPFIVPSVIPIAAAASPKTNISSHLLLFLVDIMKQITSKLNEWKSFGIGIKNN